MIFDLVLLGGGLQSALVALAVLERDPGTRLAIVEAGTSLGGDHIWSFHAGDLSPAMARVVDPLVAHRWPGYDVAFPGLTRRFDRPYASIRSERLHAVVAERVARATRAELFLGVAGEPAGPRAVRLASGERLEAGLVVDARGPDPRGAQAFQKFLGLEVELERPLRRAVPLVMDARVDQSEGFRFVYVLPLGEGRALVEDTYYDESPALDRALLQRRIAAYLASFRNGVARVLRSEVGVLPLALDPAPPDMHARPLAGGYRGGWFHPTTGYSLPAAARLAEAIAHAWPAPPSAAALDALAAEHARQARFFGLLNRLLFRATPPAARWCALERFHRLPEGTVERFYAMRTTAADRARILLGRPPRGISLRAAVRELRHGGTTWASVAQR